MAASEPRMISRSYETREEGDRRKRQAAGLQLQLQLSLYLESIPQQPDPDRKSSGVTMLSREEH